MKGGAGALIYRARESLRRSGAQEAPARDRGENRGIGGEKMEGVPKLGCGIDTALIADEDVRDSGYLMRFWKVSESHQWRIVRD